jgi:hypothetical protein
VNVGLELVLLLFIRFGLVGVEKKIMGQAATQTIQYGAGRR